jgi:predicted hydrocarbon binding protein
VRATYYSDGEASCERTGDSAAVLRVAGARSHSQADCESTAGYFERGIELLGGQDPVIELSRCRGRGDELCEFRCRWR